MARHKNSLLAFIVFGAALAGNGQATEVYRTPDWLNTNTAPHAAASTDRIIVKYKSAVELPSGAVRAQSLGASTKKSLRLVRALNASTDVVVLDAALAHTEVRRLAEEIQKQPNVDYAEPDYRMFPVLTPTDPGFSPGIDFDATNGVALVTQWYLSDAISGINAPNAWDITTGSASTVIAVIDTGVLNHADLVGRLLSGYDFIGADPDSTFDTANDGDGRDADATDPGNWITGTEAGTGNFSGCGPTVSDWHGTHVAGIIAANPNNARIAGVNWSAKILPVRVLGKCGGYTSDIVDAMRWSVGMSIANVPNNANPAHILNLSLGIGADTSPPSCSRTMQSAINDVLARGATIVVAAGNGDANGPRDSSSSIPANCAGIISTAATLKDGQFATTYSNFGSLVSLSAPGGLVTRVSSDFGQNGILSLNDRGNQAPLSDGATASLFGTSFSTAIVSGTASLLLAVNPNLSAVQIKAILQSTARLPSDHNQTGLDCGITANNLCQQYVVDAFAAVSKAKAISDGTQGILQILDGNGQPISAIDFGNVSLGTSAVPITLTVRNNSLATIRIEDILVSGRHVTDFAQTTTCKNSPPSAANPFDLSAGNSCSVTVTFTSRGNDVRTAEIVVVSNVNLPIAASGSGPQSATGDSGGGGGGGGCALSHSNGVDPVMLWMVLTSALCLIYRRRSRF